MKVLVTGAGGFIGSHTCDYFYKNGHEVIGWYQYDANATWLCENIDLMNENCIKEQIEKICPDIIIHCAGSADVTKSVVDPISDYNGNVTITHNLLFAVHRTGLDIRIIFLSSAAVYGNPELLPISEDARLNPLSPYALHKLMCEETCRYMHENYNIDIKILRIFSAYGEGLKKQIFWDMYQKSKLTGKLAMLGTGNESRDYIYVTDLVRSIYLIATKADKKDLIFNIANGEEITIRFATKEFAKAIGIDAKLISFTGELKEGNPINWRADISRLLSIGYKKTISFETGIQFYVEWVKMQI